MSPDDFNPADYLEPKLIETLDSALSVVIANKQPFGFIIDGSPGMAKTTNACLIAKYFQKNFSVESQVGRGIEQFIRAYNYTIDKVKSKVKVCIYDEANDSDKGSSRGRIQRILNQVLVATSRQEAVILIIVLHRFSGFEILSPYLNNSSIERILIKQEVLIK